ncbi:hypothetical protein HK105_203416 [Polyrhizophydium stewartii]|uniref:Uncharacterized protein n=1 Tax=Polyrhizophydium stewartii TaxID=2732419 RepID=A0ABR4NC21_9FUNG
MLHVWLTNVVPKADKQRMHMQLLMAIARQDLAQAGYCPLEVADFYDIVSDRAVEVINIMAQAGVSPNDRSEESSSSGADSDDRDDGSGGDDKVRDSGDCEDMAVAVDDDGQDSDDTRTDSKGRPTPKRARRSQPNPKDREKQRRSADTHKQRLLSIFVRTLGAGEMLRRLCDRALVASSVYPPSVRHLVRLPPHWGKVSKLHLDSRPVHMTPNNLWLHGVLIAGMLRGLELSDEERAEAKAQIARLVDEWRSELSDAQPRNRRERQSPGRGGRGGKRGPASGGAGNRRSSRGSRTSLDRGDLRSGAATSESEGDDDALGSREDVLSRDWEAGLRILAASM